jgi:hypothetical protein
MVDGIRSKLTTLKGAAVWQKLSRINVLHLCLHMHGMRSECGHMAGREIIHEGDFNLEFHEFQSAVGQKHTWITWVDKHRL